MNDLFSHRIQTETVSFKHARGSSDRSGKEFHIYHELILFLDGDGEFISEDLHMRVKPATLILIPRETYHQMVIHGDQERYCRCVLQFADQELPGDKTLPGVLTMEADQEIRYLFDKLIHAAKADFAQGAKILQAVLVLLLDAVLSKQDVAEERYSQNETVRMALEYINQNLEKPLTIQEIAQACSISPSSLAHIFKKEMYCPVHKFIVKKRLMWAYHKIAGGESATVAAAACGFQDYSGFYKQYKKAFGCPPSQKTTATKSSGAFPQ